ncbi:hypothetical protein EG329_007874 [Mollisiaceae sp. DMI_Dod_QoI]|nr:hypothetical protein EG329_007874 [Helotiales sp. DMI_Dod_QoI]
MDPRVPLTAENLDSVPEASVLASDKKGTVSKVLINEEVTVKAHQEEASITTKSEDTTKSQCSTGNAVASSATSCLADDTNEEEQTPDLECPSQLEDNDEKAALSVQEDAASAQTNILEEVEPKPMSKYNTRRRAKRREKAAKKKAAEKAAEEAEPEEAEEGAEEDAEADAEEEADAVEEEPAEEPKKRMSKYDMRRRAKRHQKAAEKRATQGARIVGMLKTRRSMAILACLVLMYFFFWLGRRSVNHTV